MTPAATPVHVLETPRLRLPALAPSAIDALLDGDVGRLGHETGARFPLPLAAPPLMRDVLPFLRDRLRACPGEAPWWSRLLVRRDGDEVVGTAGLGGLPDERGMVAVGWSLYPAFEGRGLATEGAGALVAWALAQPGVARVVATIPPWHARSLRVAERIGMRVVGEAEDDEVGAVLVYEARRA